jgi:hypothetical protein
MACGGCAPWVPVQHAARWLVVRVDDRSARQMAHEPHAPVDKLTEDEEVLPVHDGIADGVEEQEDRQELELSQPAARDGREMRQPLQLGAVAGLFDTP